MEYGLVALWLVWYLLLGAAALPFASVLFPRLPNRGASLALPLSIGTLGIVGYWVGRVQFGAVAGLAGVAALLVVSAHLYWRQDGALDVDWDGYAEIATVFAVAFLFFVGIRALDPGALPGGGEKFLDLGLLSSLARTEALPPEDVWFAGEPVQYYYGGHMIAALLAALTGTAPEFAYNLALAGYFGLLVSAAYGLAGAVAAGRGLPRRRAAILGAFFVGFASNLSTPLRVFAWLAPAGEALAGLVGFDGGRFDSETIVNGLGSFSYWDASGGMVSGINEFPFFAFLNGDLHAHMMSMPLLLLAAGLLYSYWKTPERRVWRRRGLVFGAVPPLAGLIAVVNTWSFPSVLGLTVLTVAAAPASPTSLLSTRGSSSSADAGLGSLSFREELRRVASGLGAGLFAGLLGALWAAPFFAGMVIGSTGNRSIELFPSRGGLIGLLLVHGAFLGIAALYLSDRVPLPSPGTRLRTGALAGLFFAVAWLIDAMVLVVVVPALLLVYLVARTRDDVGFEAVLFVGGAGLITVVEFVYVAENAGPGRLNTVFKTYTQVWLMFGVAGGVMLADVARSGRTGPDLRSDLRGVAAAARREYHRLRTGEAAADGGTAESGRSTGRRYEGESSPLLGGLLRSRLLRFENAGTILLVVLVVGLSLYPAIATYNHVDRHASDDVTRPGEYMVGDPTLDATAYVAEDHRPVRTSWNPDEAAAIAWVNDLDGQPTMASAPGTLYRWTNAPSSLTGVPTLAGWPHEVGYRGADAYYERVGVVNDIFTGPRDRQVALLAEYDVEYIYVGPNERSRYGAQMGVAGIQGVSVAQEFGAVTIYAVDQNALPTDE